MGRVVIMTASPPQVTLSRQKYLSLLAQNCHLAGFINAIATTTGWYSRDAQRWKECAMKTSEVIDRAIDEVRKGWVQHAYATPEGVCMVGAVSKVSGGHTPAAQRALSAIFQLTNPLCASGFNDTPGRTQDEVIAVMEKARAACAEVGD